MGFEDGFAPVGIGLVEDMEVELYHFLAVKLYPGDIDEDVAASRGCCGEFEDD